jgi:hypothetical protein
MPGQPKKLARIVAELAARAGDLSADVFLAAPRQHLSTGAHGPQADAWQAAVDSIIRALDDLERLADILHRRAGLDRAGNRERRAPAAG